ncbi:MAG: menaquinone biosynthesis protein [Phycisphaerales bacterium]|nr:MAG: menaquinone biosynthesis protein [Phycisphaerales bacterium]
MNTKPLVEGLESDPRIDLVYDVPARLPGLLDTGVVDVALVPVIDLAQRYSDWQVVSDACIGAEGKSLTVRVFSHAAPESISVLHVDGHSHTSVALAAILWKELYARDLQVLPLPDDARAGDCEAVLLIGDKVVTSRPEGFGVETDLGSAWQSLTSLPFVFAVWAAPRGMDTAELSSLLSAARDLGVRSAGTIAEQLGPKMGWPITLAREYLTQRIKFTLGPTHSQGMAKFLELAKVHDLVPGLFESVFA